MEQEDTGTQEPAAAPADSPRHDRRIRSFVRRQARQTDAQERAFRELGSRYIMPHEPAAGPLDCRALFGNARPVVLEIGFGMGHATAAIAAANPDTNYLCAEVHTPGVGALLDRIAQAGLTNIRIVHGDVVEFLETRGQPGLFSAVHVFFPDPWPKTKHHKRRLIQAPFLDFLARFCAPGALLCLATDWEDYAGWMCREIAASQLWENTCAAYAPRQEWRPTTAFERKGLGKQHQIREIVAKRCNP